DQAIAQVQAAPAQAQPVFAGGCAPDASRWSAPPGRDGISRAERQAEVFPRRRNGIWKETPFLGLDLASGEATRPSPRAAMRGGGGVAGGVLERTVEVAAQSAQRRRQAKQQSG